MVVVVPSPDKRIAVSASPNRDLNRISKRWDLVGIKLYASKTRTIIVFMSQIIYLQSIPLTLVGIALEVSITLLYWEWLLMLR